MTALSSHARTLGASSSAPLRVVGYVRQSEDREGNELKVDVQQERIETYVRSRYPGAEVIRWYRENDTSATKGPRPVFDRMVADAKRGEFDTIVGANLDRMVRTVKDFIRLSELATTYNVGSTTVTAQLDLMTPSGRMVGGIMAVVAQNEGEQKADRQRVANDVLARSGMPYARNRAFGYEKDGMTLRADEATAIAGMYADFLSGANLSTIARGLNGAGFTTTRGGQFDRVSVRTIMLNPRYAGLRAHHGEVVAPAQWPAVVDEMTHAAVGAMLADPARRNTHERAKRKWLGTGIYECGVCADGTTMRSFHASGMTHYICSAARHLSRKTSLVDDYVREAVIARCLEPDALELLADDDGQADLAAVHGQCVAVRTRLDAMADDYAEGLVTRSQLVTATAKLRAQLVELEAQLVRNTPTPGLAGLVAMGGDRAVVEAGWDALSLEDQRAVVRVLMRVVVDKSVRGGTVAGRIANPRVTITFR